MAKGIRIVKRQIKKPIAIPHIAPSPDPLLQTIHRKMVGPIVQIHKDIYRARPIKLNAKKRKKIGGDDREPIPIF